MTDTQPVAASRASSAARMSAPTRDMPTQHFGIEAFRKGLIQDLLGKGVKPEDFDPKGSYIARAYRPPAGTALEAKFQQISEVLGGVMLGVTYLQRRRDNQSPAGRNAKGLLAACTFVQEPTPWMEITHAPRDFYEKVGVKYAPRTQPILVRIEPPDTDSGFFESKLVFYNGGTLPLSAITEATGNLVARCLIGPPSKAAQSYMRGIRAKPIAKMLPNVASAPAEGHQPPVYQPFALPQAPPRPVPQLAAPQPLQLTHAAE